MSHFPPAISHAELDSASSKWPSSINKNHFRDATKMVLVSSLNIETNQQRRVKYVA